MATRKITRTDKVNTQTVALPDINKYGADDFQDVKDTVNEHADQLDLTANSNSAWAGDNRILRSNGTAREIQISDLELNDIGEIIGIAGLEFKDGEKVTWNPNFYTINIPTGLGGTLQSGQEFYFLIYNDTGAQINNGQTLKPVGGFLVGSDVIPTVILAKSDKHTTCNGTLFVATQDIGIGALGMGTRIGRASGMNTSSFSPGDDIFLSPSVAGAFTATRPTFPDYIITIGGVLKSDVSAGVIAINFTTRVPDTLLSSYDGAFRESINFLVSSNGTVITGSLERTGGGDLTMIFGDGFTILDTTPAVTIVLTAGLDTAPQQQFVYIPASTKVLTLSTVGFPDTEHIKVADLFLKTAATTQTDDALGNRNWNDHIKSTNNNGHIPHIAERLRQNPAVWSSGTLGTCTVSAATASNVYVDVTTGKVYQLHKQTFPALDSSTGDKMNIVNNFATKYTTTTNLNTQTLDSLGVTLANKTFSFVLWGVQNKTGENSPMMINLPSGSYAKNVPDSAVDDLLNYSNYTIPPEFNGKGFLIARFTFILQSNGTDWELYDTEDLRGRTPNTSGGGAGTPGIGAALQLAGAYSDETTDLATGQVWSKRIKIPFALTDHSFDVVTAPTGIAITLDTKKNGTTIWSTKPTIAIGAFQSSGGVLTTNPTLFEDGDLMTEHIDVVGSTIVGAGLKGDPIGTLT